MTAVALRFIDGRLIGMDRDAAYSTGWKNVVCPLFISYNPSFFSR
jgi:hypothetical protein